MKQTINILLIGILLLCIILGLESYTNIDIWLQNFFYISETKQWLISPEKHKILSIFFYDGLKRVLAIFAFACLLNLLFSIKKTNLRSYNHFCLMMILSFIIVPTIVAGAKYYTNVYCPYQLDIYNGTYPFVRVLEAYPSDFIQPNIGKCFPAGHSTAGFAFMGLFYAFRKKTYRLWGLCFGITLGWIAGLYQMLRGQHFLSHTMFSMVASFILIILINEVIKRVEQKCPHFEK